MTFVIFIKNLTVWIWFNFAIRKLIFPQKLIFIKLTINKKKKINSQCLDREKKFKYKLTIIK